MSGPAAERVFSTLGAFTQKGLECTIGGLNRIEVWGVWRQITQGCAGGFDGLFYSFDLVGAERVNNFETSGLGD